jgi:hypothetical protein
MKDEQIRCPSCGALFGIATEGIITIKYRDLFRSIDGSVWGPCRGCQTIVKWAADDSKRTR